MDNITAQLLEKLKHGNSNFIQNALSKPHQSTLQRSSLIDGQKPFAAILTCSDSRVVPELIFDVGLGELFIIRVAGNVANSSTIASIEYAVAHLNIGLVIVLAHQNCGAVTAAANGNNDSEHLKHLLGFIAPAVTSANGKTIDDIAIMNAKLTSEKIKTDSKIIAEAIARDRLTILPAFYSLETGEVKFDN